MEWRLAAVLQVVAAPHVAVVVVEVEVVLDLDQVPGTPTQCTVPPDLANLLLFPANTRRTD